MEENEKTVATDSLFSLENYEAITLMTVATMKMVAKKPNETTAATTESTKSFLLHWTFCSNSFIYIPPL